MTIEDMRLMPDVEERARELQKACPGVVFLSGRRDIAGQARAMAQNVALNRHYVEDTYAASPAIRVLQRWVDRRPEVTSVSAIAAGLQSVMEAMPQAMVQSISRHLVGRAFDIAPGSATIAAIEALKPRKFLQREAGLIRLHVEF